MMPFHLLGVPQVMIWDDNQTRCIGELTFRSDVRAVRLRRDRIVVVLEFKVYVYDFATLRLLQQVHTKRGGRREEGRGTEPCRVQPASRIMARDASYLYNSEHS